MHIENLGKHGIILTWILQEFDGKLWTRCTANTAIRLRSAPNQADMISCRITGLSGGAKFRGINCCLLLRKRIQPGLQICDRKESLTGIGAVGGTIAKRITEQQIVNTVNWIQLCHKG